MVLLFAVIAKSKPCMKTWVIVKMVKANTLQSALKKEKEAEIKSIYHTVPEKDQQVSAIGFEITPPHEEYED